MKLKIYRYDDTFVGKVFRTFRQSDLPTLLVSQAFGSNVIRAVNDFVSDDNIFVLSKEEIKRFVNPLNNSWLQGSQYYIRHPKSLRERYLIEAENFHDYIFREQMSEIISFVRSAINIKRIYISICLSDSTSSDIYFKFSPHDVETINSSTVVTGSGIMIEGSVIATNRNDYELEISCPQGLKVSERRTDYAWIDDFPQLMESLESYNGDGSFVYTQIMNNSFNLNLKIANAIGISTGKLKSHTLKIKFE